MIACSVMSPLPTTHEGVALRLHNLRDDCRIEQVRMHAIQGETPNVSWGNASRFLGVLRRIVTFLCLLIIV